MRISPRRALLVAFETILIVSAVAVAAYARIGSAAWDLALEDNGILKALLLAGVTQACLYYADLYDLRVVADRRELFVRMLQALGAASFILAAVYFWFPSVVLGRGVFLIAAVFVVALVSGWRLTFDWLGTQI